MTDSSTITVTNADGFNVGGTVTIPEEVHTGFLKTIFCFLFRIDLKKINYVDYNITGITSTTITVEQPKE